MKELVEQVAPHLWWSDGDWDYSPDYYESKKFLAYLFNESPAKDQIVVNDRWGIGAVQHHGSYFSGPDRWQPGQLIEHKWESAMTIDFYVWGYRKNIKVHQVYTPERLIRQVHS